MGRFCLNLKKSRQLPPNIGLTEGTKLSILCPSKYRSREKFMTIKALIWDIGGVLVRTEDQAPRAELAAELGVTPEYLVELVFGGEQGTRAQKGEISREEIWDHARKELSVAADAYPDIQERFFAGDILDTQLIDFIRSVKEDYKVGIISNAWRELPAVLEEWGILDAFDIVVGSGDEGMMKPNPKIYQIALERLKVEAREAVFVDDFIENIEAARQLGLLAIHFQDRDQALQALKSLLHS
jgi:epoxide hydrolase-like predicted phosphatase